MRLTVHVTSLFFRVGINFPMINKNDLTEGVNIQYKHHINDQDGTRSLVLVVINGRRRCNRRQYISRRFLKMVQLF